MTNHIVEFDGPDTAHGTNYVYSEGTTKAGASIKAIALNRDTYRRAQLAAFTEYFDPLVFRLAQGATVSGP